MPGKQKALPIKTYTVKRYVIEYYEVEALRREHVKDSITGGPSRVEVIKEVVKMRK